VTTLLDWLAPIGVSVVLALAILGPMCWRALRGRDPFEVPMSDDWAPPTSGWPRRPK
jgi:hypothetical protein